LHTTYYVSFVSPAKQSYSNYFACSQVKLIYEFGVNFSTGTPEENLSIVWGMLQQYWKDNSTDDHFTHLKLSMVHKPDDPHDSMPCMKGKAIECRNLIPALVTVWQHFMDVEEVAHQAVLAGLEASVTMDRILDENPDCDKLPDSAAQEFVDATWMYVQCQNAAAQHWNTSEADMIFNITIKTHYACHCALMAPFLNPRKSWNFAGEDFMQKCKILHQSCCRGNSCANSQVKFAEKYAYALHLLFTDFENGTRY